MSATPAAKHAPISLLRARIYVALAAVLWSLSGAFTKVLTQDSTWQLGPAPVHGIVIAFYRVLFAGMVLAPLIRRQEVSFRGMMLVMASCFAAMNALYVSAMAMGPAANAVLLQYTAPMWMYIAGIWWLGEPTQRRGTIALAAGLCGIGVIIAGGLYEGAEREGLLVSAIALASGVAFAGVFLCLRVLRGCSSRWLTLINLSAGALCLLPVLWLRSMPAPSPGQLLVLLLFGTVQLGLPYLLAAQGLRVLSPHEAGTITLLEPLLNPVWAYLVAPGTEAPRVATLVGGAFILGGLAYRYWPAAKRSAAEG
jgi:drug/metabolite transporter (DMT)-like permease